MKLIEMMKKENLPFSYHVSGFNKPYMDAFLAHKGIELGEDRYGLSLIICSNCGCQYVLGMNGRNDSCCPGCQNNLPHIQAGGYAHEHSLIYYVDMEEDDHCQLDFVFYRVDLFEGCESFQDRLQVLDRFDEIELEEIGRLQFFSDGEVEGDKMDFSFNRFVSDYFIIASPDQLTPADRSKVTPASDALYVNGHLVNQEYRPIDCNINTVISRKFYDVYYNHDSVTGNPALQHTMSKLYLAASSNENTGLLIKNSGKQSNSFNIYQFTFMNRIDHSNPFLGFMSNYFSYQTLKKANPIYDDLLSFPCFSHFIDKHILKVVQSDGSKPVKFHRLFKDKLTIEEATGLPRGFFKVNNNALTPKEITFLQQLHAEVEPMDVSNYYKYATLVSYCNKIHRWAKNFGISAIELADYIYHHVLAVKSTSDPKTAHYNGMLYRYEEYLKGAYYKGSPEWVQKCGASLSDLMPLDIDWEGIDYAPVRFISTQRVLQRENALTYKNYAFNDPNGEYEMVIPSSSYEAYQGLSQIGFRFNTHDAVIDPLGRTSMDLYYVGPSPILHLTLFMRKKSDPSQPYAAVFYNKANQTVDQIRLMGASRSINTWKKHEFCDFIEAFEQHTRNVQLA